MCENCPYKFHLYLLRMFFMSCYIYSSYGVSYYKKFFIAKVYAHILAMSTREKSGQFVSIKCRNAQNPVPQITQLEINNMFQGLIKQYMELCVRYLNKI